MASTSNPAEFLRLMIHTQLAMGLITSQFAEEAILAVNELSNRAMIGQQLGALGLAATAPTPIRTPTVRLGKPLDPNKESARDTEARLQAESIGYFRKRAG